jgi:glycosyltransferase involved in cell wall biosynthesis
MGPGLGNYGYSPRLIPWLRKNGASFDLWIVNGIWQYHAGAAARTARKMGKPYLVYTHGMLDPWSRRAHPIKYLKKLAYWLLLERATLRRAAAVCFTAAEEAHLARRYFPIGSWNEAVIGAGVGDPPGVSAAQVAAFRAAFPHLAGKRLLLYLSRVHPKKGLDLLMGAFARVAHRDPDLHVLIVGDGAAGYVESLQAMAARLGIGDRVTFTGPLYGERKWVAYEEAELFVLPSHQENFGIVVAEALAMRLPVCISNRVNIWREIAAAKAGLVCSDTESDLTVALEKWLSHSAAERASYAEAARACFDANFHISAPANRLFALARSVSGAA